MEPSLLVLRKVRAIGHPACYYNLTVDFRFIFRRKRPDEHEQVEEARQERETVRRMRGMAMGLSIPMSLAAGPIGGWLLGDWLDKLLGTAWIMPTLAILGTLAGFKLAIDMLVKLSRT